MSAITRIDPESQSITTNFGVSSFVPMPTNEGIINKEYTEYLALQATDDLTANDTLQFRINALAQGTGQAFVPAESFCLLKFHIEKTAAASMEDVIESLDQIAPVVGWPNVGLFKRCEIKYNGTPINDSGVDLQQAEFVTSLVNRSKIDMLSEQATSGWAFDQYMGGGACVSGFVQQQDATPTITITNASLEDAGLDSQNLNAGGSLQIGQKFRVKAMVAGNTTAAIAADFNRLYEHVHFEVGSDLATAGTADNSAVTFTVQQAIEVAANPAGNAVGQIATFVADYDSRRRGRRLNTNITTAAGANPGAMVGAAHPIAVHLVFESTEKDAIRALTKPAYLQPLGRNKGSLIRRSQFLQGSATGAMNGGNYTQFTVAYRFPCIGGFANAKFVPDGTQIDIKLVMNDLERQFRDYSPGGAALGNLSLKIDSAKMMMKTVTMSPNLSSSIESQLSSGDLVRVPCVQVAQYLQRFQGSIRDYTLRSVLGSQGRPFRLLIWSALDSVTTGNVPRGMSTLDLNWDTPKFGPSTAAPGAKVLSAGGVDVEQLYVVVNGVTYPARRLTQSTNAATATMPYVRDGASQDYAEAWNYYRSICANPESPPLSDADWRSLKLYCVDLLNTDDPSIADPTQSSVNIDVFIRLNQNTPADPDGARIVGVTALYQSQLTCNAARQWTNDMM